VKKVNNGAIHSQISAEILVKGRRIQALIDCRANINYINRKWCEEMRIESESRGEGTIRAYTGEKVKEDISIATLDFIIQRQEHTQEFRV
jgi:hypothetical protein